MPLSRTAGAPSASPADGDRPLGASIVVPPPATTPTSLVPGADADNCPAWTIPRRRLLPLVPAGGLRPLRFGARVCHRAVLRVSTLQLLRVRGWGAPRGVLPSR